MRDRPVAQAVSAAAAIAGRELDLHARHVHARGALALAALARHAQVERLAHAAVRGAFAAELAGKREAQRVRASAGEMALDVLRAAARAPRAPTELAPMPV